MFYFLVIGCAGLLAAVSCHPRPTRAGAEAASDVDNYIEQPLEQKVKYHYQYGIADAASGVFSHKWEERLGSYVKGAYSMMEADGRIRTVDYEVDGPKGFHAVVRTSPPGTGFLSSQQLRKSRDSYPNPPVNVLTNNIPSRPVLEPRTPRLIHKDLPPNFHSVKPDYYWGSAPGGHAAKHAHDSARRGRTRVDNGDTTPGTHSSYRTLGLGQNFGTTTTGQGQKVAGLRTSDQGRYEHNTNLQGYGQNGRGNDRNVQNIKEEDSVGRAHNTRSRFTQQTNVQSYNHNSGNVGSSRQTKGRRQESGVGNFGGGVNDDLSGVMVPPRKNAEVMNYDHLLRAGKITDVLYL